jgi:hypothetical protein
VDVFRKINNLDTEFARIIFKDDKWQIETLKWYKPRVEVRIDYDNFDNNCIEWLKTHKKAVVLNDILKEPYISYLDYLENDRIVKSFHIFSFLDKYFAIEFKLIWG